MPPKRREKNINFPTPWHPAGGRVGVLFVIGSCQVPRPLAPAWPGLVSALIAKANESAGKNMYFFGRNNASCFGKEMEAAAARK